MNDLPPVSLVPAPLGDPAQPESASVVADELALVRSIIRRLGADDDDLPASFLKRHAELRHQVHALCALLRTERICRAQAGLMVEVISAALRASGYRPPSPSLAPAWPAADDEGELFDDD